ncbi:hypothetical protein [Alteromonas macleodii]|uniref:hypothetical protein n=1 Tax=Alteromonas macleodii TaxID=28108 RepID=UPI000C770226|nr:hypothetical protein [Alteromonas macleodii]AUI80848.1 hypothetical protein TE101_00395 [Alteromonas macleodii]|tara:strand:- start:479 stop:1651 length:1173 start_codon:yes stop_codon:yes gene_type:complete
MNAVTTYSKLLQALSDQEEKDGEIVGKITSSPDSLDLLNQASKLELCLDSVRVLEIEGEEIAKKTISSLNDKTYSYFIEVRLHNDISNNDYYIGKNWSSLLSHDKYITRCPKEILFTDQSESTEKTENKRENLTLINKLCRLITLVQHRRIGSECIIYLREMLSIKLQISPNALEHKIPFSNIDIITDESIHKETKSLLLKENLISFLREAPEESRLDFLIENFGVFASQIVISYEKFIANYSFDKLRKEYLEKKSEYIRKINDAYDNVALKLLGLPATVWISLTQLGSEANSPESLIKDLGVLIATVFVSFFVLASLFSQFPLLNSLKEEYQGLFNRLDESTNSDNAEIKKSISDLDTRRRITMVKLAVSITATICSFIFIVVLFASGV